VSPRDRQKQREYMKAWYKTPVGLAYQKRNRTSSKSLARRKLWLKTPAGLAWRKRLSMSDAKKRADTKYRNKPETKAVRAQFDKDRRSQKKQIVLEAKSNPCADCGKTYPPRCMDFHHVRGPKLFLIGRTAGRSPAELKREIEKCVLLCCNCHRLRHDGNNVALRPDDD
jgi:hypothetical protein